MRVSELCSIPFTAPHAVLGFTQQFDAVSAVSSLRSRQFGMQPNTQRSYDLPNGGKFGITVTRERPVKTLPLNACITGKLTHATRTGNYTERVRNESRIVPRLFKCRIKVGSHFLIGTEMGGRVPRARLYFGHGKSVQIKRIGNNFSSRNIGLLCALIATTQQYHQHRSTRNVIHPITRTIIDTVRQPIRLNPEILHSRQASSRIRPILLADNPQTRVGSIRPSQMAAR
ncbi:hypothetical protein BOTU111921_00065 [Bordetella tumbae]